MGYQDFGHAGKSLIKTEDIGPGQIVLRHLSPELFLAIQLIAKHQHTGVDAPRINLSYVTGSFPLEGFRMVAANGNKYKVTMSNAGALVITQIT